MSDKQQQEVMFVEHLRADQCQSPTQCLPTGERKSSQRPGNALLQVCMVPAGCTEILCDLDLTSCFPEQGCLQAPLHPSPLHLSSSS